MFENRSIREAFQGSSRAGARQVVADASGGGDPLP